MPYRTLNSEKIQQTLERLAMRIEERFPGASLVNVAHELISVIEKDRGQLQRLQSPLKVLRWALVALLATGAIAQILLIRYLYLDTVIELHEEMERSPIHFFEGLEAVINILILMGLGIFFLVKWEERRKRRLALNDLHELRSIAHIIDMHQLTKDPSAMLAGGKPTASSPKREMSEFELMRYLDYCSELLSLAGKIAALYAQSARDALVIGAVNEIETLCTNLTAGIWQKIDMIRRLEAKTD